MAITIKDVAREAETSTCTVSRILNGKESDFTFSKATRKRVFEVARKLNYVPSPAGRAVRLGKTFNVALVTDHDNPQASLFDARVFSGLNDTLLTAGYHPVAIHYTGKERHKLHDFAKRYDGAVMMHEGAEKAAGVLRGTDLAVVQMNTLSGADFDCVDPTNFDGARMLGECIVERGYRRVKFLGKPGDRRYVQHRLDGLRNALAGTGARLEVLENLSPNSLLGQLRELEKGATVFVSHGGCRNLLALYYMALTMGLNVPRDIGLASCHVEPTGYQLNEDKPLSGIYYDVGAMASTAAGMLLKKLADAAAKLPSRKIPFALTDGGTLKSQAKTEAAR